MDVVQMVKKHADVEVRSPRDVVFQFDKYGVQKDTCYVILSSEEEMQHVLKRIVEVAVPRKTVYGASFGCEFVNSSRSHLFMASDKLDYALHGSKYWVISLGWEASMDVQAFRQAMAAKRIHPVGIQSVPCESDNTMGFLMRFERVKDVKETMVRFHDMKGKEERRDSKVTYAHPVQADVHWFGDKLHADGRLDDDGDLDEPIDY